jgi:hypothetical protein
MPAASGSMGGGLTSVVTLQGELPALTLFAPLLLLGAIAYGVSGVFGVRLQARPPLFTVPGAGVLGRALAQLRAATVPEQYRSMGCTRIVALRRLGAAPLIAALVALAFAVNR